jgi:cell division protein FtsB
MNFGNPGFVIAIVAITMVAWVITTAIRARHGYPLTDDWGNTVHPVKQGDDDSTKALKNENQQLRETVGKLEERLKVLERIATDPAKRLSDDIDNLR